MSYKNVLPTIAAVASIGIAVSAQAAPASTFAFASEPVSVRVKLADLDLANQAGAARALLRIHNAASSICGPDEGFGPIPMRRIYQDCISNTVNTAVRRLGNPMVAALNGDHRSAVLASNVH